MLLAQHPVSLNHIPSSFSCQVGPMRIELIPSGLQPGALPSKLQSITFSERLASPGKGFLISVPRRARALNCEAIFGIYGVTSNDFLSIGAECLPGSYPVLHRASGGSRTLTPEGTDPSDQRGCHYTTDASYTRRDSNPHVRRHQFLRLAWLPLHHGRLIVLSIKLSRPAGGSRTRTPLQERGFEPRVSTIPTTAG